MVADRMRAERLSKTNRGIYGVYSLLGAAVRATVHAA